MNENDTNAAPIVPPTSASGCSANDSETAKRAINIAGYAIFCGCAIVLAIAFAIHPIVGGCVLAFLLFCLAKILGQVAQELRGNKPNATGERPAVAGTLDGVVGNSGGDE